MRKATFGVGLKKLSYNGYTGGPRSNMSVKILDLE